MKLVPGQVVERYTVETQLGEGGVATVFRVRHNTLDSTHALKVIHLSVSAAGLKERLVQEGRVQASLKHPNVVSVTDVVDIDGSPGLIMELIDGPTLSRWLREKRKEGAPIDLAEAERVFRGILAGVARAHKHGLVHRDLKPGNVLMETADDGTVIPKVTDFGLAKILSEDEAGPASRTRSGTAMGTPAYMAPEQVQDAKAVDQRADVFALGCILYELVTGRSPFDRPDVLQIFAALAAGRYKAPEELVPDLPLRIRHTIAGCLMVNRDDRIQDCAMLRRVLDGRVADSWVSNGTTTDEVPRAAASDAEPDSVGRRSLETSYGFLSEAPPTQAPSALRRLGVAAAGLGLVGGVGALLGAALVVVGVGAWWWLNRAGPVAAVDVPEPAPVVAPAPAPTTVEPPPPAEPAPEAPPAAPAATPAPSDKSTERPAAPAPPPKPRDDAASVRAEGDADRVWLEGPAGRVDLGAAVPAGAYRIRADFGGEGAVSAGRVDLAAGDVVTLSCNAAFQMCQVKR